MSKFKTWLCNRFLPAWCRDSLTEENMALAARVGKLEQENRELRAYIGGMEFALRRGGRVTIRAGEAGK